MKNQHAFVFSMAASACLFFAGRFVVGSGPGEGRPLADPVGAAMLDDCRVKGRIEDRTNGVFVVFEFDNPSEQERDIRLHYLVGCTPAASPFARMAPIPRVVKQGVVECRLAHGGTVQEVKIQDPVLPAEIPTVTPTANPAAATLVNAERPAMWTLIVARHEIKSLRGWGALAPSAADAVTSIDKGEVVLASTKASDGALR